MPLIFAEPYVVRPGPVVAQRFAAAWFGQPHVWYFPRSSHALPDDAGCLALLKLAFLARIHEDAHEEPTPHLEQRQREAHAYLAISPELSIAAFDRSWTIEPVGMGHHFDPDTYSSASLEAVSPTDATDVIVPATPAQLLEGEPLKSASWSARDTWRGILEDHEDRGAAGLAALRWVVRRLGEIYPEETQARAARVSGRSRHLRQQEEIAAPLQTDGWSTEGTPKLFVHIKEIKGPYGDEITVSCHFRLRTEPRSRAVLPRGEVHVDLVRAGSAWRVRGATLVTHERRTLEA